MSCFRVSIMLDVNTRYLLDMANRALSGVCIAVLLSLARIVPFCGCVGVCLLCNC